jgi:REP element-mobilizing transposase RayT
MVVDAIQYNANILGHYVLHAFVVMSNHVHILVTPAIPLPKLTKSLKGITAKRANEILGSTGATFWREESFDHLVWHDRAFRRNRNYIENNPVHAGLMKDAKDYR